MQRRQLYERERDKDSHILKRKEEYFSLTQASVGLANCSLRDFSAHVAHVSLIIIRYNKLVSIKRTLDYDTIGGLFMGVHELTVVEEIL